MSSKFAQVYTLKTYKEGIKEGAFYIQSKGLHSGRPLRKPIKNCFVVYTSDTLLFSRVYALFLLRKFEYYIHGSVIPFVRICDVFELLDFALSCKRDYSHELRAIHYIDKLILNTLQEIKIYKQLQQTLARKVLENK
jgi:hypothetical protein